MANRNISLERLSIRMKGVPLSSARASVEGLGGELMDQLSWQIDRARGAGIDRVDCARLQIGAGATPSEIRRLIAQTVAESIREKIK